MKRLLLAPFIFLSLLSAAFAQPANVVALSSNTIQGNILSTGGGVGTVTLGGILNSNPLTLAGAYSVVTINVIGTWTGTITPQAQTCDSAGTWSTLQVFPLNSTTGQTSITGNGVFSSVISGFCGVRLLGATVASGTAAVSLTAGSGSNGTPGNAGGGGGSSSAGFTPNGNYSTPLSVTSSSSNVALPTGTAVAVYNAGATPAYCKLGSSNAVTATASDDLIPGSSGVSYTVGLNTYIACITASSTTTVNVSGGTGALAGFGGGGGSNGLVQSSPPSYSNGASEPVTLLTDGSVAVSGPTYVAPQSVSSATTLLSTAAWPYSAAEFNVSSPGATNFQFQISNDNTNWITVLASNLGTGNTATTFGGAGVYYVAPVGRYVRMNVVSYASGTVTSDLTLLNGPVVSPNSPFAGVGSFVLAPSLATNITPVVCGSAVSSCQLKNGGGQLYSVYAECSANCWLMVFNTTSTPTNGSTTAGTSSGNMQECIPIAAHSSGSISYGTGLPSNFSNGIYAAVSSTECATLTLSSVGFVHGSIQ